ncbi:Hypothetical predicted protein [Lecanosticta acicola]|uniref:Uncharacterized protein n=1 Tax=Lecanosticta acicola TaxID=111012 RepID=A0AAI9EAK3_9PEZI|nr:Hypothetical predicted protein [Lecanosticta acicola]
MALGKALPEELGIREEEQDPEDERLDRKLGTYHPAVGKRFYRGLLPHLNDVVYIFEQPEFPFDLDEAFAAEMIKK